MLKKVFVICFCLLPTTVFAQGIDFSAISRGQRQAQLENQADERYAYERAMRQRQWQQQQLLNGQAGSCNRPNPPALLGNASDNTRAQIYVAEMKSYDECLNRLASSARGYGSGSSYDSNSVYSSSRGPITDDPNWESASNIGSTKTGDYSINFCHYKTLRGYSFGVNVRGFCPASVYINPLTNQVRFGL